MTPPLQNPTSPLYAALAALISALLDGITAFGVFPLTLSQETIVLAIFTSAFSVAVLMIPILHHQNAQLRARLLSAAGQAARDREPQRSTRS